MIFDKNEPEDIKKRNKRDKIIARAMNNVNRDCNRTKIVGFLKDFVALATVKCERRKLRLCLKENKLSGLNLLWKKLLSLASRPRHERNGFYS